MAQYTFEAFAWDGNRTYEESDVHTIVIDDDDAVYDGVFFEDDYSEIRDDTESVSVDGVVEDSGSSPYIYKLSYDDADGNRHHMETFYFLYVGGQHYMIPQQPSAFGVGSTLLGSNKYNENQPEKWNYADVTCFTKGTLIETTLGQIAVEDLRPGMEISTADGKTRKLRLVLSREIGKAQLQMQPNLRPVTILAGALGQGLPQRDLQVSRQHRMLVSSPIAQRMFAKSEVLIAAIKLTQLPGIYVSEEADEVEYFHLLFDEHQIIYAEGAPSESFFMGEQAMKSLSNEAVKEIQAIFPQISQQNYTPSPARYIPQGQTQKKLVFRHAKNQKPLLDAIAA